MGANFNLFLTYVSFMYQTIVRQQKKFKEFKNEWPNFKFKPIKLLNKYERWRKVADILKVSKTAKLRLEWIIYYYGSVAKYRIRRQTPIIVVQKSEIKNVRKNIFARKFWRKKFQTSFKKFLCLPLGRSGCSRN